MEQSIIKKFIDYCECNLDFSIPLPAGYNSAPICALDSVFSIGVKYGSVEKVVSHFLKLCGELSYDTTLSTSEALLILNPYTPRAISEKLHNFQRTDTHECSILKSEAFIQFLKVMQCFNIETCLDARNNVNNYEFQTAIRAIRGQTSGITVDYFFILAGVDNYVKVDRHIERFVKNAVEIPCLNKYQITDIVRKAAEYMSKTSHRGMTARHLDHIIWTHESPHR